MINNNSPRKGQTEESEAKAEPTPSEWIVVDVPYVSRATKRLETELKKLATKMKPTAEIRVISRPPQKVGQYFRSKDEIPIDMKDNVVYKLNCSSCTASYIGKTLRQVSRRLKEHGAPPPKQKEPMPVLKRSARIAAEKLIKTALDSDSSEERNGVSPVTT